MAKRKSPNSRITGSPDHPITRLESAEQPTSAPASPKKSAGESANGPVDWSEAIPVLPYQWRWIKDDSQLKVAVWSRQSGKSFAAALRAVLKCLEKRTQYIILSKGERQSRLFMEKVKDFCQVFKEGKFLPEFAEMETEEKTMEVFFPHNRSRIIGLPANPDTARGYSGHIVLDEFAFHGDAHRIYAACFPIITRGYSIEVISTPNGTGGKFYEIAKQAGLVGRDAGLETRDPGLGARDSGIIQFSASLLTKDRNLPESRVASPESRVVIPESLAPSPESRLWSGHRVDIYDAVRQGLPADIALLRSGCDDEETWQQEYCCQFLSDAQNYIPIELISSCVHEEATTEWAGGQIGSGQMGKYPTADLPIAHLPELYLGVDIGRKRDLTIAWLFEKVGGVLWSRHLLTLKGVSFDEQERQICRLIEFNHRAIGPSGDLGSNGSMTRSANGQRAAVRRCCVDQSGLGMMLAEHLVQRYGAIVEPVQFTAALKERLAPRVKQAFEERTVRIPDHREVRADLNSVKRFVTPAGNVRFDAEHTDRGHADRFWALALVVNAASEPTASFAEQAFLTGRPVMSGFAEVVL